MSTDHKKSYYSWGDFVTNYSQIRRTQDRGENIITMHHHSPGFSFTSLISPFIAILDTVGEQESTGDSHE